MSDVTIIYCRPCGYEKHAKAAAAALRRHLALEASLVPGKGGIFQIRVGDKVVASRSKGHFPDEDEILAAVKAARH
ncbi:SelT/SelW/SelH family protein [Bradyrhizobium sp. STM 3557]|uniref:SelT/SelW/SelH family protein n=1 Tax=Bradyrhizobium sp. STM 3557 TaxID=578920 RepID=UPI00388DF8E8